MRLSSKTSETWSRRRGSATSRATGAMPGILGPNPKCKPIGRFLSICIIVSFFTLPVMMLVSESKRSHLEVDDRPPLPKHALTARFMFALLLARAPRAWAGRARAINSTGTVLVYS